MNTDLKDNETIRLILGRRSVRKFEARPVESEKVYTLLECAFAAPSSKNLKPCHVILIDDGEILQKIGAASEHARAAANAALAIAVCVDVSDYEKRSGSTDGTWMEDCSCVMMNILIAARALGLEGVWIQVLNRPEKAGIPQVLGIPDDAKLFALAVLGYSDVNKPSYSGVDESRLHTNCW